MRRGLDRGYFFEQGGRATEVKQQRVLWPDVGILAERVLRGNGCFALAKE